VEEAHPSEGLAGVVGAGEEKLAFLSVPLAHPGGKSQEIVLVELEIPSRGNVP
jgi:hypothetical protein